MKKTILFLIFFYVFSLNYTFSAWYWNHSVSYSMKSWSCDNNSSHSNSIDTCYTICGSDWDTTWWWHSTYWEYAFADNNSSSTLIPESSNYPISSSWNMRCLYWDWSKPENLSVTYTSWWTNSLKTITVKAKDRGWSKLKKIVLQQSQNWWSWTDVATWDNLNSQNTIVTRSWNRAVINWSNFKYKILAYDYAWNENTFTNSNLIRFDTTPPTISDIINNNNTNLLANGIYNYALIISENWGSPISKLEWTKENYNSESSSNYLIISPPWSQSWNISRVDNYRQLNWSRQYSFKITKICDEAWNCWTWNKLYNHNVYSNTIDRNIWTKSVVNNELSSASNIADGNSKNLRVQLKDIYGNIIIPASGINRRVNFKFNTNNSLYLNQYNRSWGSAVSAWGKIFSTWNNQITNFNNISSSDWNYNFDFKVYSPTYQNYKADPNGRFYINSVSVDITSAISNPTGVNPTNIDIYNDSIDFDFKPLFTTAISWWIKVNWLIEWAIQNSILNIQKASSTRNPTWWWVYLEFGSWSRLKSQKYNMLYSSSWDPSITISEKPSDATSSSSFSNLSIWNKSLNTKLLQDEVVVSKKNTYISSHIKYILDWKTVVYNSDILWKNNYWDNFWGIDTNQVWLKVLWLTSSKKYNEIIEDQDGTDIVLLWNISKTVLKKSIRENTWNIIKNVSINNWSNRIVDLTWDSWNNSDGKKLLDDKLLYFWGLAWANVELWIWDELVWWKKTIIVEGWNLYIKGNMSYISSSDILWIIVLQDSNWNGWNVYIDPSVTKIVWSIFADKALISYNWNELDWNTNVSVLRNQLYIYGSVFSENTIGWSRKNPLECPYYIANASCNLITSQKYDLNFLRRYFLIDDWFGALIPANSWISAFSSTSDYYKYPIVIKYNSFLQVSPPPLFSSDK